MLRGDGRLIRSMVRSGKDSEDAADMQIGNPEIAGRKSSRDERRKNAAVSRSYFMILLFLCAVIPGIAEGQVDSQDMQSRLKIAQELQVSGRIEEAIEIYESLYSESPRNVVVYSRLKDLYFQSHSYEKARRIIEERMTVSPSDPGLAVALAQIDYREGRTKAALKAWHEALERMPNRASIYSIVAATMLTERLMDEACEVYLLGRKRIGKPDLFALQLANLYGARMEFGMAAAEILLYWETHPKQNAIVESTLLRYPKTERVVKHVVQPAVCGRAGRPPQEHRPENDGSRYAQLSFEIKHRFTVVPAVSPTEPRIPPAAPNCRHPSTKPFPGCPDRAPR